VLLAFSALASIKSLPTAEQQQEGQEAVEHRRKKLGLEARCAGRGGALM